MKRSKIIMILIACIQLLIAVLPDACAQVKPNPGATLEKNFNDPPNEAKPRVWWHWMNGNVTKDGIKKDLEWMKRIGIGGFQNFDAGLETPQIVDQRLVYMTPEWKDAFQYATKLADSLDLEMAIAGSPGWSESGGPWVKPEEAMKKYVWSETRIKGGKTFKGILPAPPSKTGQFQNLGMARHGEGLSGEDMPEFYADAAVIAFKVPGNNIPLKDLNPRINSSSGEVSFEKLIDRDLINSTTVTGSEQTWVQYEFENPTKIQSITVVSSGGAGRGIGPGAGTSAMTTSRMFEASDDGISYRRVCDIPDGGAPQKTVSFSPVNAKYFRLKFAPGTKQVEIAEFVVSPNARVKQFEEKAAFVAATNLEHIPTPEQNGAVSKNDVIDLTSLMKDDGSLNWKAPEGEWIILRLGYSLIGRQNGPASPEATGLEVDKMSAKHVKSYFTNYLDQYKDATGGLMGEKGLQFMITDSWEAGAQNWTDDMIAEFSKRRGYDMIQWLPVLSGYVVESAEASDKFLWDFRRTISELIAQNHYDLLTDLLHERSMGRYSEAHEAGRALVADGMEMKKTADVPMAALWTPSPRMFGTEVANFNRVDIRESASISHIYGSKYVAAESLTAMENAWGFSPDYLKTITDVGIASGLNRFVIHCSVHQPVDDKIPGLGLGPYGQWFTRHETWAEQARAWMSYLSRTCYMMQQGNPVVDVLYFYGEDDNITAKFMKGLPPVPEGYEFDFTNADVLKNDLTAEGGKIVAPTGMEYKLLALDQNCERMTLPVLKKIQEMVKAGVVVVGNKPLMTPSLSDSKEEFKAITNELWANPAGVNQIGKGTVYGGQPIAEVLKNMGVEMDFSYPKTNDKSELLYVHRKHEDIDFYWINNRSDNVEDIEVTCRVAGKVPEIWHPETGETEKISYSIENDYTKVKIHLDGKDAKFIVFREKATEKSVTLPLKHQEVLTTFEGPWTVNFQEKRGAPAQATFATLSPWNENQDTGIKYFSGLGTYSKKVNVASEWLSANSKIQLDLGEVKNMAEVFVNGKSIGIAWRKPFVIDMTDALKPGENKIEIQVANLWVNRLVGDAQPGVENKITYTAMPFYQADSPLKPSGLLGPVKIVKQSTRIN